MKTALYSWSVILLLALAFSASANLTNFEICDPTVDLETVKVCYNDGTSQIKVVESNSKLQRLNDKPMYLPNENLTFIYEPPTSGTTKSVSIVLTLDITSEIKETNYFNFASALLAGQRLMLIQNNEYYLLEHMGGALFNLSNLKLTHIPTLIQYAVVPYPGTDSYVFTVLGGRQIEIKRTDNQRKVQIKNAALGEVAAAYVIPHNLTEEYEVPFTLNTPIKITDPASGGKLTICQADNPGDTELVQVCRNNELEFTLRRGELTRMRLPQAGNPASNYTFLYEMVGGTKQVTIFYLKSLEKKEAGDPYKLDYNNFINNLKAGRRISLKFKDNLYLLGHPAASNLSLPLLALTAYTAAGSTSLPASGSESQVEFPTLDGGKMFLKRNYGHPPLPFDLWALEEHELAPVNLEEQLFTSFSSLGAVRITNPNLGTVTVRADDIRQSLSLFKLTATNQPTLNLEYKVPQVVSITGKPVLFYYHTANVDQGVHVKSGSVYWYYDLSDSGEKSHVFNDQFIEVITSGQELALKFNNTYYLLGHENIPDQPVFFDLSKLSLKTIDGAETFVPELVSSSEISFALSGGRILVKLNELKNEIKFSSSKKKELETVSFGGEKYSVVLTPAGRVQINSLYLELCNLELYRYVSAADVCVYTSTTDVVRDKEILVDQPVVETVAGTTYLFEPNGLTGDEKQITVRRLISFDSSDFNQWDNFIAQVVSGDAPVIRAKGQLYSPVAADNLLTNFALQAYPEGEVYSLKDGQQLGPVTYNGTFTLNDTVIFAQQSLQGERDSRYLSTVFMMRDYAYLPDNGEKLFLSRTLVGASPPPFMSADDLGVAALPAPAINFITSPSGKTYRLEIVQVLPELVRLKLTSSENQITRIIFERYFAQEDRRILSLDNVNTIITIERIGSSNNANVTVRR